MLRRNRLRRRSASLRAVSVRAAASRLGCALAVAVLGLACSNSAPSGGSPDVDAGGARDVADSAARDGTRHDVAQRDSVAPGETGDVDAAPTDSAQAGDSNAPVPACPTIGAEGREARVVTEQGVVVGERDGEVEVFLGIPFAEAPVGDLRWHLPEPPACYGSPLEASAFGPACPQFDEDGQTIGDEDCLYLNIWAPSTQPPDETSFPVLFFIHGGGHVQGSTSVGDGTQVLYDGSDLASDEDVVVVTANYRLGPLGWMAHPALERDGVSGNYGALDQIEALGWVQRNIRAFGGDPERVLLFGESAGAVSTCVLVASPRAEGLFSAALMESGACTVPPTDAVLAEGDAVVEASGCGSGDDVLACLRELTPAELLAANPPEIDVGGVGGTRYGPYVDGRVLPRAPLDQIRLGEHNAVPLAVGANTDETSRSVPPIRNAAAYERLVRLLLGTRADEALAIYPAEAYESAQAAYIQLTSDAKFVCSARRAALAASAAQDQPVYHYSFAQGLDRAPRLRDDGAWHGLELFFVFGQLDYARYRPSDRELRLSDAMQSYWASLARTGDPSAAPDDLPTWPPYRPADRQTLILEGDAIRAADDLKAAECDFWDSVVDDL